MTLAWTDIRDRIDLAAVATALMGPTAKRQGHRLYWRCPFHDDHDPSFQVDVDQSRWRCWPCDMGGDAPALVMRFKGAQFPEAVQIVAELAGIIAPSGRSLDLTLRNSAASASNTPVKAPMPLPERSSGLPLADALALVTEANARLWGLEGTEALSYLRGRGLKDETILKARLGWTPGVMVPTKNGDRGFKAKGVVVPWFDRDRLALVKVRQPQGAKPRYAEAYRGCPRIFPGPEAVRLGKPLVVTEGELDCILLGQELDDLAAVVTLGSASNRPDPGILSQMLAAAPWFIATDADEAGDRAATDWPTRSIRVRPPGPDKDWTEVHAGGPNRLRYFWGRYLPMSRPWDELAAERWGPAGDELTTFIDEAEVASIGGYSQDLETH